MKTRINIRFAGALTLAGIFFSTLGIARENVVTAHHKASALKTSDAACQPAGSAIDLDINNVRARLMTGGDMWWNIGLQVAAYEIPKGSGKSSQFAASCWIGGFDKQGQLKVAAQTYRQDGNDYWPGALDGNAKITGSVCNLWDYQWKVDKSTINSFIQLSKSGTPPQSNEYNVIYQWPAAGNQQAQSSTGQILLGQAPYNGRTYAAFKDLNGDGIYEPNQGEYPVLESNGVQSLPDEMIWWVFNDAGNVKQQSLTAAIGVEVQTTAFAFATQDFLNNSTFCNYRVINRGSLSIDSTYIAVWDDCDLGYAFDDYIGCDTTRGLGIQYNGTNCDGCSAGSPVNSYGLNPPQVGLDFFQGPVRMIRDSKGVLDSAQRLSMTNFTYYVNDASVIGNPDNGVQIYFYMTGSIRTGQRFAYDFSGGGNPSKGYGSGPVSNYVFWGDPSDNSQWSECACNNNPGDRRFIFSSGPFELLPGAVNDITFGCVWAPQPVGGCPVTNFTTIKSIDDQAQALFDDNFKTVEGPEAPILMVRELDRKLLFYMVNPYSSNNYNESYGRSDGTYKDSLQYHQAVTKAKGSSNPNDSLYKFQGYRVFQLANSNVSSADIFNQTTGEVDNTVAQEVFECDIHDGVTQIVNYVQDLAISSNTFVPQIKVVGKDSGIVHSFVLTTDQFATGSDNQFINYHTYYFVAIAYGYNNFATFNDQNAGNTQGSPYIGSSHGYGGTDIKIVPALPNPSNGDMGTVLNAGYGSGVAITRLEGQGNGGNFDQLDAASEAAARDGNFAKQASYLPGNGPINVKVIDPVVVPAYNWALQIVNNKSSAGFDTIAGWRLTAYDLNGNVVDTIYSEQELNFINEQILSSYGISVNISQPAAPGVNQLSGNGYIGSDISFADSTMPWLEGVPDQADSSFENWLRAGKTGNYSTSFTAPSATGPGNPCNFDDNKAGGYWMDSSLAYENMFANFGPTKSTWGPYVLAASYYNEHVGAGTQCGFEIAYTSQTQTVANFETLPDIDLVLTDTVAYWTRCAVVEEQEDPTLAQGGTNKFWLRAHAGWNLGVANDGTYNTPVYDDNPANKGMSWFPGYAIDQSTGKRLNIVFGEDSYLGNDNGADMIWNPDSSMLSIYNNSIIFGGKHIIYVLNTQYDSDKAFVGNVLQAGSSVTYLKNAYANMAWVGVPILNPKFHLAPLNNNGHGLIPTQTRLRFRVNRPYSPYLAVDTTTLPVPKAATGQMTNPYYTFSTKSLVPTSKGDNPNAGSLVNRIFAVPNPYYGYSGYENNRFDTKVRIINLPAQVYVNIYTLDGTLVRSLSKNDPSTPYIDWDIKNTVGLPVSSGMYLIHVNAVGIGETVIKWFGAMRPLDVTSY